MRKPREDAARTREQLLEAAIEIFAAKSYREATLAEICTRAGVNSAAANYHFRNKETLYREAWRQSFTNSIKAHPIDGGVSPDAPAALRLHGHIKALLERITDNGSREFMIVQQEMASPTGLLDEVMLAEIEPMRNRTQTLIRELLGPAASEDQVKYSDISVLSQCINPAVIKTRHSRRGGPRIENLDAYIEHVYAFTIGGLTALKNQQTGTPAGEDA